VVLAPSDASPVAQKEGDRDMVSENVGRVMTRYGLVLALTLILGGDSLDFLCRRMATYGDPFIIYWCAAHGH
jgi:hypothetical protein